MNNFDRLFRLVGFLMFLILLFSIQIFIGLVILSFMVVPITFIYSMIVGRSYNSVIDSSGFLYRINKIGHYAFIALVCLILFYSLILL